MIRCGYMIETSHQPPIILAFIADLMFAVKIETAARHLNYRVQFIGYEDAIAPAEQQPPERQLAEHLSGQGAVLVEKLTRWKPCLMVFDLGNNDIPWRTWIPILKSAPATRRIPILCYGSHVEGANLKAAQSVGADAVLARSKFVSDMPALFQNYARIPDYQQIESACGENLSDLGVKGIEEFNRGEYFQAHETLEEAWNEDQSAGRELYRAILQVAVAYLQIERDNYRGAMKMFLRVRQWIDPLPDTCRGVDIARLRADAENVHQVLLLLGQERLSEFDHALFKPLRYDGRVSSPG